MSGSVPFASARRSLILALVAAGAAAQPQPSPDASVPVEPKPAVPVEPKVTAPAPLPAPKPSLSDTEVVAIRARAFFAALLAGDAGPLVKQAELPFLLEDRRLSSGETLKAEWLRELRAKRTDLLALKGLEILTPDEMEKRFGKPPARLSSWPLRSGKTLVAVANISGRAAIALYHHWGGDEWRVVAYHD